MESRRVFSWLTCFIVFLRFFIRPEDKYSKRFAIVSDSVSLFFCSARKLSANALACWFGAFGGLDSDFGSTKIKTDCWLAGYP